MTNTGVFGLSGYNDKNLEGLIADKTREAFREYGYFSGGSVDGFPRYSKIERIDYSNDTATASIRKPLPTDLGRFSTFGDSNKFYTYGGRWGGITRTYVYRLDYSNDSVTRTTDTPTPEKYDSAGTGNFKFGYSGGGQNPSGSFSTIERLDYSNDLATASVRGPLSSVRNSLAATGNSNFGYYGGGPVSTVDRINYSNDLVKVLVRGPLSSARFALAASGNSNFGYFGGGTSTVDRINYSNDTATASVRGPLSASRRRLSASGNSNFGYFGGGDTSPALSSVVSIIDRIDYANDTLTASARGTLNIPTNGGGATSSHSFGGTPISQYGVFAKPFGYFGGGASPGNRSSIDRIDYSNDTSTALVRNQLLFEISRTIATGNSNFGYFASGENLNTIIQRLQYSNDTKTIIERGNLNPPGKGRGGATGNSNFGYFGGGGSAGSGSFSSVDRLDYANDNLNAQIRGPLSSAKRYIAATGNSNFGYFGGGGPGGISTIDRIDYSNDTATASVIGTLSSNIWLLAATSNQNFGYFGGGGQPSIVSTVDRIDYSNDTATASVRGPLSLARNNLAASGNSNFGYFGGGGQPSIVSTVDRIDYSNDTATASVRGPLSLARNNLAATSPTAFGGATDFQPTQQFFDIQSMSDINNTTNESVKKRVLGSYGYFGGGYASRTEVYRLDFSNDTAGISRRGNLESGRRWHTSFANRNYGYQTRGTGGNPNRIDYSNDTATALSRPNLPHPSSFYGSSVSTNNDFAFTISSGQSTLHRIDYSNDNQSLARGKLVFSINRSSGVGKKSFAYVAGGNRTWVQRLEYANDNSSTVNRGNLEIATNWISAQLGNDNFGYFVGGGSQVQRVEYANDLVQASIRGPLSSSSYARTGTGNFEFGWVGFNTPANTPGPGSQVERIDYSNDLVSPQIRTNGSGLIYSVGMGNAKF
jgi:hypothetical protein